MVSSDKVKDAVGLALQRSQRQIIRLDIADECVLDITRKAKSEMTHRQQMQNEEISTYKNRHLAISTELADCRQSMTQLQSEIEQKSELLSQSVDLRRQLHFKEEGLAVLQGRVDALTNSMSWRITAPLRWVFSKLHKM
jgi:hypothetical protein